MEDEKTPLVINILRELSYPGATVISATEILMIAQTIIIQEADEEDRDDLVIMIDSYLENAIKSKFEGSNEI